MSAKFFPVRDFYGFGVGATESDLAFFAQDEMRGPVTMQVYNPSAVDAVFKVYKKDFAADTYAAISAFTTTVKPGGNVRVTGNVGGRFAKITGSGNGMLHVWYERPAKANDSLSVRTV